MVSVDCRIKIENGVGVDHVFSGTYDIVLLLILSVLGSVFFCFNNLGLSIQFTIVMTEVFHTASNKSLPPIETGIVSE